jgi:hypothetical protein
MKKLIALCTVLSLVGSAAVLAAPPTKGKKPAKKHATKIVDLWTCPITGEAIKDHKGAGAATVGNKRVHFCCGSCAPAFAKLSAKEKQAKVNAIAKKETGAKKGKS